MRKTGAGRSLCSWSPIERTPIQRLWVLVPEPNWQVAWFHVSNKPLLKSMLVNLPVSLSMSVLPKWPWLLCDCPPASRPSVAGAWIWGRGRSPSRSEGAHATLSSAPGAETCSVPWLADSIRRLVLCVSALAYSRPVWIPFCCFWEAFVADDGRFQIKILKLLKPASDVCWWWLKSA